MMQRWIKSLMQSRAFHPTWIVMSVLSIFGVVGVMAIPTFFVSTKAPASTALRPEQAQAFQAPTRPRFSPPAANAIPSNEFGEAVLLGRNIFRNTQVYAKNFVGNGLNCVNCHLDDGRKADAAPLWAAYVKYPAFREKNHKVNTYEERLAGCFRFSMNGTAPAADSKEMIALVAYSFWLAQGAPTGVDLAGSGYPELENPALAPDVKRGASVFEANCVICHGATGQGTKMNGKYVFPPLWGKESFNAGAGMSRVPTAAAFILANMPLGKGYSLTQQEAWDVAQYLNSHERPPDSRLK